MNDDWMESPAIFIDKEIICDNAFVCHPFIYLKTRDSCHSISKAFLYQHSPVLARKIRENQDITELYIDISDPKDGLMDFILLTSNIPRKILDSDVKSPDYDVIIKLCEELQMYDLQTAIIGKINTIKFRNQPSKRYTEDTLLMLDKIIRIQHLFLDLTEDNIELTKSLILNEGYLETEEGIEKICSHMLAASISRFNHRLLANIVIFIISKTPNFNTKGIFLQIALSYAYYTKLYMLIIVFYLIEKDVYSSKEIFNAIYPRCLQYPAICQLFMPEIYENDPIIAQNLTIYTHPMMFGDSSSISNDRFHRISRYFSKNNIEVEFPDDNFSAFKELRKYGCLKNSIHYYIMNDDIDALKEATKDSSYDFCQCYECPLLNMHRNSLVNIDLIGLAAFYGSLECFQYILDKIEINNENFHKLANLATAGGKKEIIKLLEQEGVPFENCVRYSIKYHRPEILKWIIEVKPSAINKPSYFSRTFGRVNSSTQDYISVSIDFDNLEAYILISKNISKIRHTFSYEIDFLIPYEFIEAYKYINLYNCIESIKKYAIMSDSIAITHLLKELKLISFYNIRSLLAEAIKSRSKSVVEYLLQEQAKSDIDIDYTPFYLLSKHKGYDEIANMFQPKDKFVNITFVEYLKMEEYSIDPIFLYAIEIEPDFEISTRKGKWLVHSYILFSISLVAQRLYYDNPNVRKLYLDVDLDLSPYLDFFKGKKYIFKISDYDLFEVLEMYSVFKDNLMSILENEKSFNLVDDTIELHKCFIDVTQENIIQMKECILNNSHTIAGNYQALVDSLIISIMSRPGNRLLSLELASLILNISPDVITTYLSTVFNKCFLQAPVLSFTCHLLEKEILDKELLMFYLKQAVATRHQINNIVIYFAPEIEEILPGINQTMLKEICGINKINLLKLHDDNWKLLRELRVHGEAVGSALYYIKYDMVTELINLNSVPVRETTSIFDPYDEVNNKSVLLIEYAMFYSSKKCYDLLLHYAKGNKSKTKFFNIFAISSGFVQLYPDQLSFNEEYDDENEETSIVLNVQYTLRHHRTNYFVQMLTTFLDNDTPREEYHMSIGNCINLECFKLFFELFGKTIYTVSDEYMMRFILFFAGRKDYFYNLFSQLLYAGFRENNFFNTNTKNDLLKPKKVKRMRIFEMKHKFTITNIEMNDFRNEQVFKQKMFNINESKFNKTLLDIATFFDNEEMISILEANKALRNRLFVEDCYNSFSSHSIKEFIPQTIEQRFANSFTITQV